MKAEPSPTFISNLHSPEVVLSGGDLGSFDICLCGMLYFGRAVFIANFVEVDRNEGGVIEVEVGRRIWRRRRRRREERDGGDMREGLYRGVRKCC